MKSLFVVLVLSLISFPIFAEDVELGSEKIELNLEYAYLDMVVACITKYPPYSEGEEYAELFIVKDSDFKIYSQYLSQGYEPLNTLRGGLKCSRDSTTMKHLGFGIYDTKDYIKATILAEKAEVKGSLVMVKFKKLEDDFSSQRSKIIDQLLK